MTDNPLRPPPRVKKPLPQALKDHQWTSTEHRREEFLRMVATGFSTAQARAAMQPPVSLNTFNSWKKRYPSFRARLHQLAGNDVVKMRQAPEVLELTESSRFADRRYVYFGYKTFWHHAEMEQAVADAPAGGITLVLLPPDHGKSTWVQDWISDRIGRNPNVRIIYLTGGLALARKAIGRQQGRLDVNGAKRHPRFHLDHGPFHEDGRDGKPWTATHFTVCKATHDEQDYTMEAKSWTAKIAGTRVDDLIIDDIQELSSLNQTAEMVDRFQQDFQSRVRRLGRTIIIGTRVGDEDFYNALVEGGLVDKLVMLPATDETLVERCELDILADVWPTLSRQRQTTLRKIATQLQDADIADAADVRTLHPDSITAWLAQPLEVRQALLQLRPTEAVHGCDLLDTEGIFGDKTAQFPHERPMCPEMWPSHALARKRRTVKEAAWWRNFQQKPKNARDSVFTEDMIEGARNRMLTYVETLPAQPRWRRFAGLDPSLTGGNSITVCESNGATLRVLDVRRDFRLTRTEAVLEIIEQEWKRWRFTHLTIEENAFQKGLVNDERLANLARLCGFRLKPHTTGTNKADRDWGVGSMAQIFRDDQIQWAYGCDRSKQTFKVLETELAAWREGVKTRLLRQDTVMSLWFAWIYFQERRRAWIEDDSRQLLPTAQGRRLPWDPQGYRAVQHLARSLR